MKIVINILNKGLESKKKKEEISSTFQKLFRIQLRNISRFIYRWSYLESNVYTFEFIFNSCEGMEKYQSRCLWECVILWGPHNGLPSLEQRHGTRWI